jgi:hypothetical protein
MPGPPNFPQPEFFHSFRGVGGIFPKRSKANPLCPPFSKGDLNAEAYFRISSKALPQFNEKMVKMQIKMVKMALPILPEIWKSPSLLLPSNKKNNKIK